MICYYLNVQFRCQRVKLRLYGSDFHWLFSDFSQTYFRYLCEAVCTLQYDLVAGTQKEINLILSITSNKGDFLCFNNLVQSSWNVMAHGDAREGKWRGNWRMEWAASTLHTTSEHGVSSITTVDAHTSAASSLMNWRPRNLNGLVRFAQRRNLVFVRVPSHFKRNLHDDGS